MVTPKLRPAADGVKTSDCKDFQNKESRRFLKKTPQKLLLCWFMGVVPDNAHEPV
jgi:hypothetical protein